jgi:hypothetical protein
LKKDIFGNVQNVVILVNIKKLFVKNVMGEMLNMNKQNNSKAIEKEINKIKENLKECYCFGIIDNEQLDELWRKLFIEDDRISTKNEVINEIFNSIERISRFCKDDSIFRGELNMYLNKLKQEDKLDCAVKELEDNLNKFMQENKSKDICKCGHPNRVHFERCEIVGCNCKEFISQEDCER